MPEENAISPANQGQAMALGVLWLGFIAYAVVLSPPSTPDTLDTLLKLSTGQWVDVNPMVVVLFNLMGLWPVVYAAFALTDGRDQSIPAWPFVLGAFGFGAFALMPYLALRKPTGHCPYRPEETRLLGWLNHRLVGVSIVVATCLLMAYGVSRGQGDATVQDFCNQFVNSQFIHVMSLDFCMLTLLTPAVMWDDMARRQLPWPWRGLSCLPLLGPGLYLALRPNPAQP